MASVPTELKLSGEQVDDILNRIVPLIAKPEDHGFFRGILWVKLSESTSCEAARFIKTLLDSIT